MTPLRGFICPEGTECAGRKTDFESCLSHDHDNCLPLPLRNAIADTQGERTSWFSPSQITMCLRKAKWSLTKDFYEAPMQCYAAMRGNIIHEILEKAAGPGCETELAVSRPIDGTDIVIHGTIDMYKDSILYDYKTQKDMGFKMFKNKPYAKDAHVWQANIYRWMMLPKYEVKDIKVVYMGLGNVAVTGENIIYDEWGKASGYDMDPCPVFTEEKVYDFLKAKADIVDKMDDPPADTSLGWLCIVCPFTEECQAT